MSIETASETTPRRPRRRLWVLSPAFLATLAILIAIRTTSLSGLPEIAEPFDSEVYSRPIPDESNAFVLYKQAYAKLVKVEFKPSGNWPLATPIERQWLTDSREALDLWKRGTERADSSCVPPQELKFTTILNSIQAIRQFARLASLEGTRLQEQGDMAGALEWYLATIRCSRHIGRRGCMVERLVGIAIGAIVEPRIIAWADDPRVTADLLRKALDSMKQAWTKTAPTSDAIKAEYKAFVNSVDDPGFQVSDDWMTPAPWSWSSGPARDYFRALRSIKREPERSRRVVRLIVANWLPYCDRPPEARPPFAKLPPTPPPRPGVMVFGLDLFIPETSAPENTKVLTPEALNSWFDSTLYAKNLWPSFVPFNKAIKRDQATFAKLIVTLASKLYERENGKKPAQVDDLVGRYIEAVPEGYVRPAEPKVNPSKPQ